MSIVSSLSSSSIESQIYAIACVSSTPWSSGGSPSSVSINSFSLSSCRVCGGAIVSHQVFLFFVALGKKVGAAIARSPCTSSGLQTLLIVCKMCLVGVKILTVSSYLWDVQDSPIFSRVSDVNPHFVRRVFHVPLEMVHPWVGWARVVNPSCVMTVEPCMFSSHRRDFCWIWTLRRYKRLRIPVFHNTLKEKDMLWTTDTVQATAKVGLPKPGWPS
jgi:hypothetical protein